MTNDPTELHGGTRAPTTTPARLGRFVGHVEREEGRRRWRGRLPFGAVAPLLAGAVAGSCETLVTAEATEAVRVGAVWFDAERGEVECELESSDAGPDGAARRPSGT
jgi:hypothetical protein